MRTITTTAAAAIALISGGTLPALGQGSPQVEVPVACIIDYAEIGVSGPGIPGQELVLDGTDQSAVANLVGTPPNEKIQLVCTDTVGAQAKPVSKKGFPCQIFRGRRGGQNEFVPATDTSISIDKQGRVTMRCSVG